MQIKSAEFSGRQQDPEKCPAPVHPEYAFIGRSNVGKSSLINMLVERKKLAKISSTPGKTRLINHFLINGSWYLVDLPGYGYARISESSKATWKKMVRSYLKTRKNLQYVFILVDARLSPQALDLEFIEWLGKTQIPFCIVFTKADKLKKQQVISSVEKYKKKLNETWEELPVLFISSAIERKGRDELLEFIAASNLEYHKNPKPGFLG